MAAHNIVITGPEKAGKSQAISTLCGDAVKKWVSLTYDTGELTLANNDQLHFFEAPSLAAWEASGYLAVGIVILLDNSRPDPFSDLQYYLAEFASYLKDNAVVIGITHLDIDSGYGVNDYIYQLQSQHNIPAIFEVDPRQRDDIARLIQSLLFTLDPGVVNTTPTS